MGQSSVIFAIITIGFIVYVTTRGELPQYLQVLGIVAGSPSQCGTADGSSTTNSNSSSGGGFLGGLLGGLGGGIFGSFFGGSGSTTDNSGL